MNNTIEIDEITYKKEFSICTLVTNMDEYNEMLKSFNTAGFDDLNCEFLYIDNSNENKYDAYSGLNKFLNIAIGKYIILCHQDILLNFDNIEVLSTRIKEINEIDPNWAILANAGYKDFNNIALRITDPWGTNRNIGTFPSKVNSIDENFILVKNDANLTLSNDIGGFHLYGTDLVVIADILGYTSYVIDFHLYHKSGGNANESFYKNKQRFIKKYTKVTTSKFIRTPVTMFIITSFNFLNYICNRKLCYSTKKRWDKILEFIK